MQGVKKQIIISLATGLYVGKIPVMPGTFGTLLGIPVVWLMMQGSPIFYLIATAVLLFVSVVIAEFYEIYTKAHDPGEVVIDEVVGYAITMALLPMTWQAFLAGFIVFRFFDILKPSPICHIDRKIQGGLGTVLDDAAAGLISNIVLQIVYTQTSWLGVQLHAF